MPEIISKIIKRSGDIVKFDQDKITNAIYKAAVSVGKDNRHLAKKLTDQVILKINDRFHKNSIPAVEEIQDVVEEVLMENAEKKIAKAYILYREQHRQLRDINNTTADEKLMEDYLGRADWRLKENSNMSFSVQGLNNYIASAVSAKYWLNKMYPENIRKAHIDGDLHIHDLGLLAPYCCGWDLKDLLLKGFRGVSEKVQSKAPKHFRSALGQIINFFYTLQGEAAGAQAFANFDTYLAPFIRYDKLDYNEVKQCLQEFMFNINVPTRVGFQCMSEDTEILGENGWKKYNEVQEGDTIATFNLEKEIIEYLPVKHVFAREYEGVMYNLKNRISDQLISPEHRVVRRKFNNGEYILEKIEDVFNLKSPFIVPVGSSGNIEGDNSLNEDIVNLIAWVVSEGTLDPGERGDGRISIYQSEKVNPHKFQEIISICSNLNLKYTRRLQKGLGEDCDVIRFDADSSRQILAYFNSDKNKGIKFVPDSIIKADTETARMFLETYIKGDGSDGCKICTTSEVIRDQLMQVIVNAGYGATILVRKPDNDLSKKDRYIIRLIRHQDTYINRVEKVDYKGIIWCPNTKNETVIARRNGKIFITGNTPFTNITLDVIPSPMIGEESVIIGGKAMPEKYKDFQKEMDMFNKAFAEVMLDGDSTGRVFGFPIPTYCIDKEFDWNRESLAPVWEMTAKYGIPYFSNFVNSDMNRDDARSMCCRLRLDNRELRKRGGGLFGANPMTGSLGVVTINLPRLGYLSKTKEEFKERLLKLMEIAKESLEIKRKIIDKLTEDKLYPYSMYYLESIKARFGSYWRNHFSTIGINGMNEAALNLMGKDISTSEGQAFAGEILDFMREKLMDFQNETNNLYNLEATPGEGCTYRFAKKDQEMYPGIISANSEAVKGGAQPYYTNSTHLHVSYNDDIFSVLDLQDGLQTKYTGGTVLHGYLGERLPNGESAKKLVKKIVNNYKLPYFTITPTFSICPKHGYLAGEHKYCPKCDAEIGYEETIGDIREAEGADL